MIQSVSVKGAPNVMVIMDKLRVKMQKLWITQPVLADAVRMMQDSSWCYRMQCLNRFVVVFTHK